ncbi:hypothetical protein ACHAQF_001259 [Verticillium nonalfalfae]
MATPSPEWTPGSWRSKPIKQAPAYPDAKLLQKSVDELSRLPPIVHPKEIVALKQHLRDVAKGEAFLLQGGDCAELFSYCEQNAIESKIKLLLQMSLVLVWGADKKVVRIGRMAGQPLDWGLGHVRDPELKRKYSEAVLSLTDMLRFLHTIGADKSDKLDTVDLFTSHEGLLLEYEQPLTRLLETPVLQSRPNEPASAPKKEYYNTSAHFLWIGDRTRQIDHAHVEFFRGIANPIGIKVGPTTPVDDLLALLRTLNPSCEPGKITLITRYGAAKVRSLLPAHIRAVEDSEYKQCVVWQCDPMHGNTQSTGSGIKTRKFGDIFEELQQTLQIHKEQGSFLGGVHLELTGDAVTECLGGSENLDEDDLSTNYTSFCDPRLNEKQALELAFLIADHYRKERRPSTTL